MADSTVTLLAAGDIGPEIEPADHLADLVAPVLRQADLRFANCERTYTQHGEGAAYGHGHPDPRMASVFDKAGIDVISMANNHTMNHGPEALLETMEVFRDKHVIGVGRNIAEARKPAIVECNGIRIAFLAYCSVLEEGHEAGANKVGIAPMRAHSYHEQKDFQPGAPPIVTTVPYEDDLQALVEDVKKTKRKADAVVMSIHWGLPHVPKGMATYQPTVAHAAIDAGVDLILGHHPHCLKAIEVYRGKVCFYSLGNFIITHPPGSKQVKPANWNRWNLWWYRMDDEYLPPKGLYNYPPDSRRTMLAKAVFSKKGVERVSFLPAFISPQAQPAVLPPGDPKFYDVLEFVEWLSDQHPHHFRVDGDEVIVDSGSSIGT